MQDYRARFTMESIVEERMNYLKNVLEPLEEEFNKMPQGNLLVLRGTTENAFRYYVRKTPQDKYGEYLNKTKENDKRIYARKKYLQALIKNIKAEISDLQKVISLHTGDSIIDTYNQFSQGVIGKIRPVNIDDETYVNNWKMEKYVGLGFDENDKSAHYSDKNERMRSKSEVLIANTLNRLNIPYKYECPIEYIPGKNIYPDFTILDIRRRKVIYWEHLGRMGDVSYVSKNLWKLEEYKKLDIYLGVNLFITTESMTGALGRNEIMKVIEHVM